MSASNLISCNRNQKRKKTNQSQDSSTVVAAGENIHLAVVDLALQCVNDENRTIRTIDQKLNKAKKALKRIKLSVVNQSQDTNEVKRPKPAFGDCPICFDPLGNNPLASTKCGHVFCLGCIRRAFKVEKKCPTCRTDLKCKKDYHPLYLSLASE